MCLSPQDFSDLFRWMVKEGLIDLDGDGVVDEICSLIEGRANVWQDEWREFQASQPRPGIGFHSRFQG